MSSLVEYHYVDLVGNLVDRKSTFVGVSSLATTLCLSSAENRTAYHFP